MDMVFGAKAFARISIQLANVFNVYRTNNSIDIVNTRDLNGKLRGTARDSIKSNLAHKLHRDKWYPLSTSITQSKI